MLPEGTYTLEFEADEGTDHIRMVAMKMGGDTTTTTATAMVHSSGQVSSR